MVLDLRFLSTYLSVCERFNCCVCLLSSLRLRIGPLLRLFSPSRLDECTVWRRTAGICKESRNGRRERKGSTTYLRGWPSQYFMIGRVKPGRRRAKSAMNQCHTREVFEN